MKENEITKFIKILQCPICKGDFNRHYENNLSCAKCGKDFKIHKNNIIKLFTPENIYPTKEKIYWKDAYE